jgi:two-component system, NtrC family, sensor kinase
MESNNAVASELKKVTRELESYKIELHQTRGYLHCILQNSTDMIFATDVTGIVISFSAGAEKVLGYSLGEVIGRSISDFAEDPNAFEHVIKGCQVDGCALTLDFHFRHKEGHTVHCHASLMSLTNRAGKIVGTVGVCNDITQWKKLQDDLVQVDRLAEIGRIAAGVAHEINNPLAVISEASGWAQEVVSDAQGLAPEDRQELSDTLSKIAAQTRRGRHITHKLLDFTRQTDPTKTEFDVNEVLRETVDLLSPELKHSPITVDFQLAEDPLVVNSDPRLLQQVFVNVVTNAIHAVLDKGDQDGKIGMRTKKVGPDVRVDIQDNGVGIPEEAQEKMFRLFYTTKPPGRGTGLGLSICQNIIQRLGGAITFESTVGTGSTFTIRIPIG